MTLIGGDVQIMGSAFVETIGGRAAGVDVAVYDGVRIEPTDVSFLEAARFAREGRFDGYVSVGGGSVIDTCKAAILYATYPADFLTYVNAPVGAGAPVPGALPPHLACPTTSGTGSPTARPSSPTTYSATSAFGPWPAARNLRTYRPSSSASTSPGSDPPSRSGVT